MTPRHRVLPLLIRIAFGGMLGGAIGDVTALWIKTLAGWCGATGTRYETPVALFSLIVLMAITVSAFLGPEMARQRSAYRIANNRCVQCDYPLRGIRGSDVQCPECGRRIKPRS